jgi:DNA-binding LytR/AlgR family response regulator
MEKIKKHYFEQFENPELFTKIKFLEADKNYSGINFINGDFKRSAYNLLRFETLFKADTHFKRIHKRFIVNARMISKVNIDDRSVTLQCGTILPISRRKLKMAEAIKF